MLSTFSTVDTTLSPHFSAVEVHTQGLLKKSQVCQIQGGRVKMYGYTSNEANEEDGMSEASLKISILRFSDAWIKTYSRQ